MLDHVQCSDLLAAAVEQGAGRSVDWRFENETLGGMSLSHPQLVREGGKEGGDGVPTTLSSVSQSLHRWLFGFQSVLSIFCLV